MEDHIRRLGILSILTAIISCIVGVVCLTVVDAPTLLSDIVPGIVVVSWMAFMILLTIPYIVAGIGLIGKRSWARPFGMIVTTFGLINVPLGTVLGLYGLWVLMSPQADAIFSPRFTR